MCTRTDVETRALVGSGQPVALLSASQRFHFEQVALVADARRNVLLRVHRHRLRSEDLEDCLSQATLELLTRVQQGRALSDTKHIAHALEQKFLSRIIDRQRALGGRSPMQAALDRALPLEGSNGETIDVVDVRAAVEELVMQRLELTRLRELAQQLTHDQQLVLACQVSLEMECAEFCALFGWSTEKYRKVAQRARARLKSLAAEPSTAAHLTTPVPVDALLTTPIPVDALLTNFVPLEGDESDKYPEAHP